MKKLVLFLILLFNIYSSNSYAAITYTGVHIAASSGDGNNVTTGTVDTTGSTLLEACIGSSGNPTLTDSKSNTWTALTPRTSGPPTLRCYYVLNPTVGSGHTFTASSTGLVPAIAVIGFAGTALSGALDTQNGADSGGFTTILNTGSITPSASTNVAIAALSLNNVTTGMAVDSGFTITDTQPLVGGLAYPIVMSYKLTLSASENPQFSWTTSALSSSAIIADFKIPGASNACHGSLSSLGVGGC